MENDLIFDLIFGGEAEMDCRGPLQLNKAVEEEQDPIGSFLKTQELDHLAKNLAKVPITVVVPTTDEILGLSAGDELLKFEEPAVEHVEADDLHKRAELSDEEVAEIKEYEERHSVWS